MNKENNSHYYTLGLQPGASPSEIKSAFRRLVKLYHVDKDQSLDAEMKYKEIREAYGTLIKRPIVNKTGIESNFQKQTVVNYGEPAKQSSKWSLELTMLERRIELERAVQKAYSVLQYLIFIFVLNFILLLFFHEQILFPIGARARGFSRQVIVTFLLVVVCNIAAYLDYKTRKKNLKHFLDVEETIENAQAKQQQKNEF